MGYGCGDAYFCCCCCFCCQHSVDSTSSTKARTSSVPGIPTILGQDGLHSREVFSHLGPPSSRYWCLAPNPSLQQVHVQQDPNHRSNSPCESCQHAFGRRLHLLQWTGKTRHWYSGQQRATTCLAVNRKLSSEDRPSLGKCPW